MTAARRALLAMAAAGLLPRLGRAAIQGQVAIGQQDWLFPAWEDVRQADLPAHRRVAALVAGAVTALQEAGIATAVVMVPMKARIYPDLLPPDFQWGPEALRRYEVLLEEITRAPAIMPDLAGLFTRLRRSEQETLFFRGDMHWKPVAAAAAATELGAMVEQRLRLPPSRQPGMRLGPWGSLTFETNDLASLLPEAERRRWPPERYRVRQMPSRSGSLVEEDEADLVVVGNSFAFPGFGFAAHLSQRLNRPVSLFARVAREGHWRTLLNYLGSDLFRRQRPRLLVWQMLEGSMAHMPDQRGFFAENAMPPAQFLAELRRLVARA